MYNIQNFKHYPLIDQSAERYSEKQWYALPKKDRLSLNINKEAWVETTKEDLLFKTAYVVEKLLKGFIEAEEDSSFYEGLACNGDVEVCFADGTPADISESWDSYSFKVLFPQSSSDKVENTAASDAKKAFGLAMKLLHSNYFFETVSEVNSCDLPEAEGLRHLSFTEYTFLLDEGETRITEEEYLSKHPIDLVDKDIEEPGIMYHNEIELKMEEMSLNEEYINDFEGTINLAPLEEHPKEQIFVFALKNDPLSDCFHLSYKSKVSIAEEILNNLQARRV